MRGALPPQVNVTIQTPGVYLQPHYRDLEQNSNITTNIQDHHYKDQPDNAVYCDNHKQHCVSTTHGYVKAGWCTR